jgi:hypothetical protein
MNEEASMYETIEIRVRKGTFGDMDEREWNEIPAIEFSVDLTEDEREPEKLAGKAAAVPGVWEVRWNWGGNVAGIGQGHYVPGEEHKNKYHFLREATE